MFRDIFKRRGTVRQDECRERGILAAPVSMSRGAASQTDSTARPDIAVDEAMIALDRELSGLARLEVGQAAKERGWASLQRELERRPVRTVAPALAKGAGIRSAAHAGAGSRTQTVRSYSTRWALGAGSAAVVVIATALAVVFATSGPDGPILVDNGSTSTTVASVVTSDTTEPTTPATTDSTVPSTDTTVGTTPSTSTTGGSTHTTSPNTTQPTTATTLGDQQNAAAQRERDAKYAVTHLANVIVSGDRSGARNLVDPAAYGDLSQMTKSLNAPSSSRITDSLTLSDGTVRVVIEFYDTGTDANGNLIEVVTAFVIKVRVDEEGPMVIAISKGS